MMKRNIYLAIAIAMGACGSSAWASSTWSQNLVADCTSNATSQSCSGTPSVAVSGWSTTGSGSTFAAATVYNWGTSAGLGVVASNESSSQTGPHATDNVGSIDAMLLNFTSGPVNLSNLSIGWNGTDNATTTNGITYNDSDLSILAWTGVGTPTMSGSGLLGAGWTLIGNYGNVGSLTGNTATATNSIYSSYWLISAYSTAYGTTSSNGQSLNQGNDAFKVLSVAGNTCTGTVSGSQCNPNKTPEPGSIALLGVGMLGLLASRRRLVKR
jgi:hypothetical protein